ncbi:MAG: indole-3-glycerol phosphate synthase TrpC [Dissulfuribacterales bacterium]
MGTDFLTQIVEYKKQKVKHQKQKRSESSLRKETESRRKRRPFIKNLKTPTSDAVHVIAEIKRASPSKGDIRPDLDPSVLASAYERGGASAISVLTEERWFKGSIKDMQAARSATSLPILRKDFIISKYQIYESAAIGADAILLIVRILSDNQIKEYLDLCETLKLDALVEIHTPADIKKISGTSARLIGINNRNLSSFETDIDTAIELVSCLENNHIPVAASGIKSRKDIEKLKNVGINNFLIGESIVRTDDPELFIKSLIDTM